MNQGIIDPDGFIHSVKLGVIGQPGEFCYAGQPFHCFQKQIVYCCQFITVYQDLLVRYPTPPRIIIYPFSFPLSKVYMSHSNSKIVAISTVKHLSRNYASFQQPSVQEWYSLSTSGQTQSILKRNTADFHGDGYFLQNAGFTKGLRIAFVVCDC